MNLKSKLLTILCIKRVNNFFLLLFIATIYYLFLFQYPYGYNYLIEINKHYLIFSIVLVYFLFYVIFQIILAKVIVYNSIDIFFAILLGYSFCCIAANNVSYNLNNEYFVFCIVMLIIYFIVRTSSNLLTHFFAPILFSFFFLVELYIGIKQAFINRNVLNLYLAVQGSLNNSGIYSIFLVINLPFLAYTLSLLKTKEIKNIISIIGSLLVLFILLITQSRTAVIMIILLGICVLSYQKKYRSESAFFQKNKKTILIISISVLIICVAFFSFYIKRESAFGRLLIWQITLEHITDTFFTGIGLGNFPMRYTQWQIAYFAAHPNPVKSYFLNADETHVAFNEYLQFLSEIGVFVFVCFVLLFLIIFRVSVQRNFNFLFTTKTTLSLILFSALFSYPLHCTSISFVFVFSIASLSKASLIRLPELKARINYKIFAIFFLFSILSILILKSIKQTQLIAKWEALREDYFLSPNEIKTEYAALYPFLNTNGKFLLDFGERLTNINKLKDATNILEASKKFYISYRTFISTADANYKSNNILETIKNLELATNLIPSRFYPKYILVKLYFESGDTIKAKQLSNVILTMPVKKMSSEIIAIKNETLELQFKRKKQ